MFRVASRPIAHVKSHPPPKLTQIVPLNARKFSATPQRLFLDECIIQTHSLITGIHDTSGLSWGAIIPLSALLIRVTILIPIETYCRKVADKKAKLRLQYHESRPAIEKKIQREHRDKTPLEIQQIQNVVHADAWRRVLKRTRVLAWTTSITFIRVPICFMMMDTIRRMTGTEDGMLHLAASSLAGKRQGHDHAGPDSTATMKTDELIPMDPSLSTEGILWFSDLTAPDPLLLLPFALSGITFMISRSGGNPYGFLQFLIPGGTSDRARRILYWDLQKNRILQLAALAIGPATLVFPSGMLLYSMDL